MTNKEIAERLRKEAAEMAAARINGFGNRLIDLADEIDPPKTDTPKPEPGTIVQFCNGAFGLVYREGVATVSDSGLLNLVLWGHGPILSDAQVRILADDEVAVKIPPVSEWPELAVAAGWVFVEPRSNTVNKPTRIITRAEAERMGRPNDN